MQTEPKTTAMKCFFSTLHPGGDSNPRAPGPNVETLTAIPGQLKHIVDKVIK
jgi:hypothetical protein